jgi:hypothetical protein
MAMETYFKNFNKIQYGGDTVIDITERVVTLSNVQKNPIAYYPYDISMGDRPDQIAYDLYKDPYTSWILYLSNDILDPYYDWYLSQEQFNQFIVFKYGSLSNATQKIAYWRNDWVDKPNISTLEYDSEIVNNPARLKYWTPNYNAYNGIIDYSRVKEDWVSNTNRTVEYNIVSANPNFILGEFVDIAFNDEDQNTGRGQIVAFSDSVVTINQTIGHVVPGMEGTLQFYEGIPFSTLIGRESGAFSRIMSGQVTMTNISNDEIAYWKPVSYYDMENEKNEGNKFIQTLQPQFAPKYVKNVKDLLRL